MKTEHRTDFHSAQLKILQTDSLLKAEQRVCSKHVTQFGAVQM